MHILRMELSVKNHTVGDSATLKVWERDTFAPQMMFQIDAHGAKLGAGADQETVDSDVPAHFINFGLQADLIGVADAASALDLLRRSRQTQWSWES